MGTEYGVRDGQHHSDQPVQKYLIVDEVCVTCSVKGMDDTIIQCKSCCSFYHAICKASVSPDDGICNKSLIKLFKQPSTKKNFTWECDFCITNKEIVESASLKQQVASLVNTVSNLATEVKSLKSAHCKPENVPLCDKTVWGDRSKLDNIKSTLLIKNHEGQSIDMSKVKTIAVSNNIQVSNTHVNDKGDAYVNLPSVAHRDKISNLLQSDEFKENEIVPLKSKLPSISIVGVDEKYTKEELMDCIKMQNESIRALIENGQEFSIVFLKEPRDPSKNKFYQIVARVSGDIRSAIKSLGNKLYIGLISCNVHDRFFIKRCNKCQGYGHYNYSDQCTQGLVCGYCCSNSHKSNDCPLQNSDHSKHSCVNCQIKGRNGKGHSTFWHNCPTYLEEQDRLKKSIGYNYNQKN